jgi:hypothetical protein
MQMLKTTSQIIMLNIPHFHFLGMFRITTVLSGVDLSVHIFANTSQGICVSEDIKKGIIVYKVNV